MWERYLFPESVQEALEILKSYQGEARIIAGGTDLIPELKSGVRQVRCLVDISRIEELRGINKRDYSIRIGAAVTHSEVANSELIKAEATVLAEAAFAVGSPQIRNQGTIAGNVVNAQPAADTAVALFALEAEAEILNKDGIRVVPIQNLYQSVGKSLVDSTYEVVVAFSFKSLRNNQGSAFTRLAQRKALALPMISTAVVITVENNFFQNPRIVIAPVAYVPFRSGKAEAALNGAPVKTEAISKAADAAFMEAQPRDSALRGSTEYRKEMVKVFVRRAVELAVQKIKQN